MRPIALVTGGSSNIGWACVRRLARRPRRGDRRREGPRRAMPAGVRYLPVDITDAAACQRVLADAGGDRAGGAGALGRDHRAGAPIEQIPPTSGGASSTST
jgi:NAD(P)-dependent dehydrogenase (short-subunit alcohol dehydrogenase family)